MAYLTGLLATAFLTTPSVPFLSTMSKTCGSACVQEDLVDGAKAHSLLMANQRASTPTSLQTHSQTATAISGSAPGAEGSSADTTGTSSPPILPECRSLLRSAHSPKTGAGTFG